LYFMENRARLLDLASFLDRIDRYPEPEQGKKDFRYRSLQKALQVLIGPDSGRAAAIQKIFSDPTNEPIESAVGLVAHGAWNGGEQ
jgi:hypothetical protein